MTTVLHVDSSARREGSVTRQLGQELLTDWRSRDPDLDVAYRDLSDTPPSLVDARWVKAALGRDPSADRSCLAESEALIAELEAADVLLLGVPMYNFGVPAVLKAWLDQVVRQGRTFGYDGPRPVGLVVGVRAVILASSGGDALAYEHAGLDFRTSYLRAILGFLGMTDVRVLSVLSTAGGAPDLAPARRLFDAAIGDRLPQQREGDVAAAAL